MVPSCDAGKGVCHEGKGKRHEAVCTYHIRHKNRDSCKAQILDRYYAGMFDDIYAVEHDDDKVRFILKKAAELGIEPSDCELVEDTYRILLQTVTEGIKSTHITTILTGGCER